MKCPACNGTGLVYNALGDFEEDCGFCHGTGNVVEPHTNEAWLCSLSTKEKAEWFGNWHSFSCVFCKHWKNGCVYNHNQVRCAIEEGKSNKELWMEWLKEKHE